MPIRYDDMDSLFGNMMMYGIKNNLDMPVLLYETEKIINEYRLMDNEYDSDGNYISIFNRFSKCIGVLAEKMNCNPSRLYCLNNIDKDAIFVDHIFTGSFKGFEMNFYEDGTEYFIKNRYGNKRIERYDGSDPYMNLIITREKSSVVVCVDLYIELEKIFFPRHSVIYKSSFPFGSYKASVGTRRVVMEAEMKGIHLEL